MAQCFCSKYKSLDPHVNWERSAVPQPFPHHSLTVLSAGLGYELLFEGNEIDKYQSFSKIRR